MGHLFMSHSMTDQGPLLKSVSLSHYAIAVVFVILRFITRGLIVKKLGVDDLFMGIAVIFSCAQTMTLLLEVENGRGRHANTLSLEQYNKMLMYKWINMLSYFTANWAVKSSILALYYRIGHKKPGLPWIVQSRTIYMIAGFITAFSLATLISQFFACTPINAAWNAELLPKNCIKGTVFMQSTAAINVATDILLLALPLPLLPILKFNTRQRTALAIILSIGLIPAIASTLRLYEIILSSGPALEGKTWQETDSSWLWAWVPVWSQIEVSIGILAASLPSLSPLLSHLTRRDATSSTTVTHTSSMSNMPDLQTYHARGPSRGYLQQQKQMQHVRKRSVGGYMKTAQSNQDSKFDDIHIDVEKLDSVYGKARVASHHHQHQHHRLKSAGGYMKGQRRHTQSYKSEFYNVDVGFNHATAAADKMEYYYDSHSSDSSSSGSSDDEGQHVATVTRARGHIRAKTLSISKRLTIGSKSTRKKSKDVDGEDTLYTNL